MLRRMVLIVVLAAHGAVSLAEDPQPDAAIRAASLAHHQGNLDAAIESYGAALRIDPNSARAYAGRAEVWDQKGEPAKAVKDFRAAIRLDPKLIAAYNNLAWVLATCPKDAVRDGKKAVQLARKACELDGWREVALLDTLAAAYAEAGDFKEAVRWQETVVERHSSELTKAEPRARLAQYQQSKPLRQQPQPPGPRPVEAIFETEN